MKGRVSLLTHALCTSLIQYNSEDSSREHWVSMSSLNSLPDAHWLHVGSQNGSPCIEKNKRDVFVKGRIQDVLRTTGSSLITLKRTSTVAVIITQ